MFQPFLMGTTQTSATFTGQAGHTYAFYSVATSNVGIQQTWPTGAEAHTTVTPSPLRLRRLRHLLPPRRRLRLRLLRPRLRSSN